MVCEMCCALLCLFIVLVQVTVSTSNCYFPGELQGVWATQAAPDVIDAPIAYSMVTIHADQISTWGKCYAKVDDNIILSARSGPNSAPCFRCFRLVVASVNVAALVSGGLTMCWASVEDALASCPTTERGAAHIVLYKVRASWGESGIQETQCPFSGIYFFSYEKGARGSRDGRRRRCEQPTSEMSNCPFGFSLSLQFRDCTFEEPRAASWHCLGSWKGLDGQHYAAVYDMYSKEGDGKPKYKCGIYEEDKENKRTFLAFSRDSTCTNELLSATEGHERFILYTAPTSPLPTSVRERVCRFPTSLRGRWHNTDIRRSTITYRDERNFDTLQMQCVREYGDSERYAVYTRTDCGKWFYSCVLLKRRSANVIEIMFGERRADTLSQDICNVKQFGNNSAWVTQAKTHLESPTSCPIVGTYRGELPDSPGYCAQLFSDCKRTDLMYYAVDECKNPNAIYERKKFPQPLEVTPGVFIPPERFDNSHHRPTPPSKGHWNRDQSPSNIPREIQIGTMDVHSATSRIGLKKPEHNVGAIRGAALIIAKRRKREASNRVPYYNIQNPKTTTLSFAWGKGKPSPTTDRPLYNNRTFSRRNNRPDYHSMHDMNIYSLPDRRPPAAEPRVWEHEENYQASQGIRYDFRPNNPPSNDRIDWTREIYDHPRGSVQSHRVPPSRDPRVYYHQRNGERESNGRPFLNDDPIRQFRVEEIPSDQRRYHQGQFRSLPINETRNTADPLGFWPRNNNQGLRQNPDIKNIPVHSRPVEKGQLVPEEGIRGGPNSPVPSLRDISSVTTPTSFHSEDQQANTKQMKTKEEEREYQCIGQWEENGRIFALTKRRDIHTYECFVGVMTQHGIVYMKEAGPSCRRDVQPDDFGMKTVIKEECIQETSRSKVRENSDDGGRRRHFPERNDGWRGSRWISSGRARDTSPTRPPWVPSTTRPWKPITGRPRRSSSTIAWPQFKIIILNLFILQSINSFL